MPTVGAVITLKLADFWGYHAEQLVNVTIENKLKWNLRNRYAQILTNMKSRT